MKTAYVWADPIGSTPISISLDPQDVRYLRDCHSLSEVFEWLRRLEPQSLAHVWPTEVRDISMQDGFQVLRWGTQGV